MLVKVAAGRLIPAVLALQKIAFYNVKTLFEEAHSNVRKMLLTQPQPCSERGERTNVCKLVCFIVQYLCTIGIIQKYYVLGKM